MATATINPAIPPTSIPTRWCHRAFSTSFLRSEVIGALCSRIHVALNRRRAPGRSPISRTMITIAAPHNGSQAHHT